MALGTIVKVDLADGSDAFGIVRFVGSTAFGTGDWVGVELEERLGRNNGSVKGKRYFQCRDGHGLFVRPARVERVLATTTPVAFVELGERSAVQHPRHASPSRKATHRNRKDGNKRPQGRPARPSLARRSARGDGANRQAVAGTSAAAERSTVADAAVAEPTDLARSSHLRRRMSNTENAAPPRNEPPASDVVVQKRVALGQATATHATAASLAAGVTVDAEDDVVGDGLEEAEEGGMATGDALVPVGSERQFASPKYRRRSSGFSPWRRARGSGGGGVVRLGGGGSVRRIDNGDTGVGSSPSGPEPDLVIVNEVAVVETQTKAAVAASTTLIAVGEPGAVVACHDSVGSAEEDGVADVASPLLPAWPHGYTLLKDCPSSPGAGLVRMATRPFE